MMEIDFRSRESPIAPVLIPSIKVDLRVIMSHRNGARQHIFHSRVHKHIQEGGREATVVGVRRPSRHGRRGGSTTTASVHVMVTTLSHPFVPSRRFNKPEHQRQERRLPCTSPAHDANPRPARDGQADPSQHQRHVRRVPELSVLKLDLAFRRPTIVVRRRHDESSECAHVSMKWIAEVACYRLERNTDGGTPDTPFNPSKGGSAQSTSVSSRANTTRSR